MPKKIRHYFGACFIIICLFLIKIIVFLLLYHLKFKFTGIKKHTVCHSEERGISSSYSNYEIPRSSE